MKDWKWWHILVVLGGAIVTGILAFSIWFWIKLIELVTTK